MRRSALLMSNRSGWPHTPRMHAIATERPLFQLQDAIFPNLHPSSSPLSLTINDYPAELWAVIAPHSSSSSGSKLLHRLISALCGRFRPQQRNSNESSTTRIHPSPHLFTKNAKLIALASFSKQQVSSNSEFQDFSARYGALREEDVVTVFESLMDAQGFEVGKIAAMKVVPDKLKDEGVEESERKKATAAMMRIQKLAPLLGLHKQGPGSIGGVPLLYSPVISLSNGQLRRARIVSSLVRLDEASSHLRLMEKDNDGDIKRNDQNTLLVLDQPYSGLDESSRSELTTLLAQLHHTGRPRVILVLRRQDEVPEGISHIVDIDTEGRVWAGSRSEWRGTKATQPSGVEGIRKNNQQGIGVGKGEEVARLSNVSVQYGDKVVLDSVNLTLRKGSRLIIKGANGSGKTTLLSLLSGSHPRSYSFSLEDYALFGKARSTPSNASRILSQKIGYFGPDLLTSFPRKGRNMGGLSIKDAVACGFTGVFSRVSLKDTQSKRVGQLLDIFRDCLSFRESGARTQESNTVWWDRDFIQLDGGSQAVTLFLRAIVNRPAILILDEPFQGMDAVQINRIRLYIDMLGKDDQRFVMGDTPEDRQLDNQKAADCAVILVSHYINEWPDGMGEYLLLDNGKVIEHI